MARPSSDRLSSSPKSTGGAGTSFEQHVGAYWLAQLLVRGIPPILIDTVVTEVILQTERLGWQTDDFLVICARTGAASPKLAGQVKRNFIVSATNDECRKATASALSAHSPIRPSRGGPGRAPFGAAMNMLAGAP
jgi:hypothetical protein